MPKSAARSRRSVATVASTALIGASLAVLLLPVSAPVATAAAAPGSTQRASVRSPANDVPTDPRYRGAQDSVLSGNGESVVFTSQSRLDPSLDVGSGERIPYKNVFVRDLVRQKTIMLSRGQFDPPVSTGTVGVRMGGDKLLNLQPGGGGGTGSDGVPGPEIKDTPPTGNSYTPSVSADGRFVAFITEMNNMFPSDTSFRDKVVIVDRDPDADGNYDEEVTRFGVASKDYKYYLVSGREGDFCCPELPKIAGNASRIVWVSDSEGSDLRTSALNFGAPAGTSPLGPVEPVPAPGIPLHFRGSQDDPAISGDGNHIVFHQRYFRDCGELSECLVKDFHAIISTDMSKPNKDTFRVDIDAGKPISNDFLELVQHPAVNRDGSVIAFVAEQFEECGECPPFSAFNEPTTYVVQAANNKVTRTDIVSRDNDFKIINGDRPGLSADGRYIAFVTNNFNAHDGADGDETNEDCIQPAQITLRNSAAPLLRLNALPPARNADHTTCQVVMRDLIVDLDRRVKELPRLKGTLVSPNTKGNAGNGNTVPQIFNDFDRPASTAPSLSDNGGRVAYDSDATDLVTQPADDDRTHDVFVRTLEPTLAGRTVDFGKVQINTSKTLTAVLTENGFGPIDVDAISVIGANPGDYAVGAQTCTAATVHETGSCEISVAFSPKVEGDRKAQLLVRIKGNRRAIVDLTGEGTPEPVPPTGPNFSAQPDTLAFGNRLLLSTGPEASVTVNNTGESPLLISKVEIVGATGADYKVSKNTCGATVAPGATCAVTVAFSPKASGNRNAVLRFEHNSPNPGSSNLIGLTGTAPQPTILVNPGVSPPGRVVTVLGRDFPPNLSVTVKFDARPGQTVIKAGTDGTFKAPLLIFPKASPETRSILATMAEFPDPLARTPLLVVFPTVTPANFVVRG